MTRCRSTKGSHPEGAGIVREASPVMENQMEKKMENEMDAGVI